MFNKVGVFYVQPCFTYITAESTDMILKRVEKVLLKKNQRYRFALPICENKGFKILLSLLSYVKKMLNKLYNLFAYMIYRQLFSFKDALNLVRVKIKLAIYIKLNIV